MRTRELHQEIGLAWRIARVLLLVALTGAAAAQTRPTTAPATQPTTAQAALLERIHAFLLDLDGPDPDLRDKAAAGLLSVGPPAIAPLKKALAEGPSPEFKARAEHMLLEIPKQWRHISPDGGEVVGSFQAVLRAQKSEYPASGEIALNVEIRNVGPADREMFDIRAIDVETVDGKMVLAKPEAEGKLVIRRLTEGKWAGDAQSLVHNRAERSAMPLGPGGVCSTVVHVEDAIRLPAGEYEVAFVYYASSRALLKDASDDLRSNAVKFTVKQ